MPWRLPSSRVVKSYYRALDFACKLIVATSLNTFSDQVLEAKGSVQRSVIREFEYNLEQERRGQSNVCGMPNYGNRNFWDERYAAKGDGPTFDWYQDWSTLEPVLSPYLGADPLNFEILIPGCGNSRLGADLYNKGYLNITNVDSSEVVVKQMEDRFRDLDQMEFTTMDARDLNVLPDNTFDLIIDKALFDALLCSDDNIISVNKLVREMHRVLKPGGVYVMISHGPPDARVGYLRRPAQGLTWSVETTACPKPVLEGLDEEGSSKSHFLYSCRKI